MYYAQSLGPVHSSVNRFPQKTSYLIYFYCFAIYNLFKTYAHLLLSQRKPELKNGSDIEINEIWRNQFYKEHLINLSTHDVFLKDI